MKQRLYTLEGKFFEAEDINEVNFTDLEIRRFSCNNSREEEIHLTTAEELCEHFGLGFFDANWNHEEECNYFKSIKMWADTCRHYNIKFDLIETPANWGFTEKDQEKYGNVFTEAFESICYNKQKDWWKKPMNENELMTIDRAIAILTQAKNEVGGHQPLILDLPERGLITNVQKMFVNKDKSVRIKVGLNA